MNGGMKMVMIMMTTSVLMKTLILHHNIFMIHSGGEPPISAEERNRMAFESKRESHGRPIILLIGRLASFISLRDIKIRVYDSSGLSSDVSLSPVCAH